MMDETNITSASSTSQISSLLLGHLLSSTTSTSCVPTSASSSSSPFQGVLRHHWGRQMPFSSYAGPPHQAAVPTEGDATAVSLGFDPAALLQSGETRGPPAVDLDPSYDGESEVGGYCQQLCLRVKRGNDLVEQVCVDGLSGFCDLQEGAEVSEERPKPPAPRSGSKRSRAAEVHNLSEKRRRSRINEKMKALQNLIPNSNKTDKASMLDEAIEYLKQLQLQVQMLSMRNGLSLQSMYLPSTLQTLQASQTRLGLGVDNGSLVNMGVGIIPVNQQSSAQNSFEMSKHCTPSHQHMMPGAAITNAVSSIGMEASQFHHGSFPFSLPPEEMYKEDMVRQCQLGSGHVARNMSGNEMKSMNTAALPFEGQASSLAGADHLEACMLSCGRSEDVSSKGQDNQVLIQHLHGLQTGRSASSDDVKAGMMEFR